MKLFVTGASGWVGSAVVPELLANGHQVVGLARSDASAEKLSQAGADVHRGDLADLDSLRSGAKDADGVIHLAFHHDFDNFTNAGELDRQAITALGETLAGIFLVLGLFTGIGSLLALFLTMNYGLATWHMSPANQGFHYTLAAALVACFIGRAGMTWGLDGVLADQREWWGARRPWS